MARHATARFGFGLARRSRERRGMAVHPSMKGMGYWNTSFLPKYHAWCCNTMVWIEELHDYSIICPTCKKSVPEILPTYVPDDWSSTFASGIRRGSPVRTLRGRNKKSAILFAEMFSSGH
jgi:hypothetical protein